MNTFRQAAVLIKPQLRTNNSRDPFWTITAGTARLPDTVPIIQLDSHVVLTTRSRSGAERILTTEQMLVDTSQNHAYSDLPVRIESISGIVAGTGFHADLNTHRMELLNQVRSRHEERSN
jgi:LPS export ABC transporter protein LptC